MIIASVTELSKRYHFLAALLVSLPLTSIVALSFVYLETKDIAKVSELSTGIFWLVIPSLAFFLCLPFFLKLGWTYWTSLAASIAVLSVGYFGYAALLKKFGVSG